jgi:hypothetical protein
MMKTIEEKAKEWMEETGLTYEIPILVGGGITEKLVNLLTEQDRDIRHVCAERVLTIPEDMSTSDFKDTAHRAIVNTKP